MAGAKPPECHRKFSCRNFSRPNLPTIIWTMGWLYLSPSVSAISSHPIIQLSFRPEGRPYLPSRSGEIPLLDF